jgi:branched-chain amino acid transport system permease protein
MVTNALNGLVYGSLLFILSSGLVLVYGLRRVVNFAHGALYMLGAYLGYSTALHFGFTAGLVVSGVVLALVGIALDVAIFRKLSERNPLVTVIVTFGLLLILEDLVRSVWGTQNYALDPPTWLAGTVVLDGAPFPVYRLAIVVASAVMAGGLVLWLRYGRTGLFVRAASKDPAVAAMFGVKTDLLGPIVVGLGAAFAGLAGVLAAPFLSLNPAMGGNILVLSFVVTVVGGLGSFVGAFQSALLLGQVQSFGTVYTPELASLLPFILMAVVLVFRPQGLAGTEG